MSTRGVTNFGIGYEQRAPLDLLVEEAGVLAVEQIDRCWLAGAAPGEQAFRLFIVCRKGRPERDSRQIHVRMP